ncbi:MAG: YiiX/YebB-like N1pC/P60 family cysteine hydrolase [Pseudomonadota bacterium]
MLLLFGLFSPVLAGPESITSLRDGDRVARQANDLRAVVVYRQGIARLFSFVEQRADLFPATRPNGPRLLSERQRETVRTTWKTLLDYYLALDALERYHGDFHLMLSAHDRARSHRVTYAAFLAKYRFGLDFIRRVENDPKLAIVLNDAVPELGLPVGSYDRFKFRFLNVLTATRFAALNAVGKTLPSATAASVTIAEDEKKIWQAGKGEGGRLTAANAMNVIKQSGFQLFFPVQAGVSEWMGDAKVHRVHRSLVSPGQIDAMRKKMLPGDFMLQRREWYVSNVGLPGFWSHAALYIGTPEERRAFFAGDGAVQRWIRAQGEPSGDFEKLLQRRFPKPYALSLKLQEHGHAPRVIEAISEGVSFTTLEHSADADSVATLRPRIPRAEIALAILRSFRYSGRPYDFNFDFQTDATLVCTELIYKAYEPGQGYRGVRLQLEEMVGRTAIPANSIARQFHEEFGTPRQQLDMVLFLDGQEKRRLAVEADVGEFRKSWRRPKWHVVTQDLKTGQATP